MRTARPPVDTDRAPASAIAANTVRWVTSVTPLDIGRAGLVLSLLATPLPTGALMNVGLAVALGGALLHAWSGGLARRRLPAAVWLMVAFAGATTVSALVAIDPWCGFASPAGLLRAVARREELPLWCGMRGLLDTTRSTLFFVLAVILLDGKRLRRTWLVVIVAITFFVTASGLLEYALGHRTAGRFLRDAAIGHSNQTGSYLVMALPVSVAVLVFGAVSGGARALAALTLGLGALALVLTQSLTAWVAGIVLAIVLGIRIASRRALVVASAVAMLLTMIVIVVAPRWEKFTATWLAMSTGWRLSWWAGALRVIADHPLFGVGPRNFSLIDAASYDFRSTFHAHNLYLNIGSEHGLVGLALLLAALVAIGWRLKHTHGAIADDLDRACWWAAASAVLAFVVLGLATTPYHSRHAILLWSIVGLFYSQFRDRTAPVGAP